MLTPGQAQDLEGADELIPQMTADTVIADNAFDAEVRVIKPLRKAEKGIVIPPKRNAINPGILLRTFLPNLRSFVELPRNTISSLEIFLLLFTWLPRLFGLIDDTP